MSDSLVYELKIVTSKAAKEAEGFVNKLKKDLGTVPFQFDVQSGVRGLRAIRDEAQEADKASARLFDLLVRNVKLVNNELGTEVDLLERIAQIKREDHAKEMRDSAERRKSADKELKNLDETDERIKKANAAREDRNKLDEEWRKRQAERANARLYEDDQRFRSGAAANVSGAAGNQATIDKQLQNQREARLRQEKQELNKRFDLIEDFFRRRELLETQYQQKDKTLQQQHQMVVANIERNGHKMRLVDIQHMLNLENVMYAKSLQKQAQTKQQGTLFGTAISNKTTMMMFQGQQVIEDMGYGARFAANNIAMMASTLGGPAGLIAMLGITAFQLPQAINSLKGLGETAESIAARGIERLTQRLETFHDQMSELRNLSGVGMPTSMEDWRSKALGVDEDTRRYRAKFEATERLEEEYNQLLARRAQAKNAPAMMYDEQLVEALDEQVKAMRERLDIRREELAIERALLDQRFNRLPHEKIAAGGFQGGEDAFGMFKDSIPDLNQHASSVKALSKQYDKLRDDSIGGLEQKFKDLKYEAELAIRENPNGVEGIMTGYENAVEKALADEQARLQGAEELANEYGNIHAHIEDSVDAVEDAIDAEKRLIEQIEKRIESLRRAKEENQTTYQGKMFDLDRGIARKQADEQLTQFDAVEKQRFAGAFAQIERLKMLKARGAKLPFDPSKMESGLHDLMGRRKEAFQGQVERQLQGRESGIQAQHEKMLRDRAGMFGKAGDMEGQMDALKELQALQMQQAAQARTSGQMMSSKKSVEETQAEIQALYDRMREAEEARKEQEEANLGRNQTLLEGLLKMKTEIAGFSIVDDSDVSRAEEIKNHLQSVGDWLNKLHGLNPDIPTAPPVPGDPMAGVNVGGMPVASAGVSGGGSTKNSNINSNNTTSNSYSVSVAGIPQRPSLTMRELMEAAARQAKASTMQTGFA